MNHLTDFAKFRGEYTKTDDEKNIYYYGWELAEIGEEDEEKSLVYSHIGFIKHKKSGKSVGLIYEHNCADWTSNCKANTEQIKEHFWGIVKSVKFDEK